MRVKQLLILALLVVVPLALLAWLGARVARSEREEVRQTFDELLRGRLQETDRIMTGLLEDRGRAIEQTLANGLPSGEDRVTLYRSMPWVQQFFSQAADGTVLTPSAKEGLSRDESDFLDRCRPLFDQKLLLIPPADSMGGVASTDTWYPYYWGHDLRLLYLIKTDPGGVRGAELSRSRLIADLIGRIPVPATDDPILREGSMLLVDSGGRPLFRWGGYLPSNGERPRLQVSLSPPLHQWSVQFFVTPTFEAARLAGNGSSAWLVSLLAVGIALAALALVLYREQQRELMEAAQRVSFVNQVSHELKTPLTNIRLHAELLEQELPEEDESSRRRIEVVISESQRLGRLIGNVLSFSRQQRDRVVLRRVQAVPDETVRQVIDRFAPAMSSRNIVFEASLAAVGPAFLDPDVLEQVLNNLLSNVEKYAASGGRVLIATRQEAEKLLLLVRDRGPGIPADKAEFVFQPFARLHDELTEGVSGAGIGLSISRELARRHGGELRLVENPAELQEWFQIPELLVPGGACFLAVLKTVSDA